MDGDNTIKRSYDYLNKLKRENATDMIKIDYTELDVKSKRIIKDALDRVLRNRSKELYNLLVGVNGLR